MKEDAKNEAQFDKFGVRDFDVYQHHLHSESVNFEKFTKSPYELAILDALNQSTKRKQLINKSLTERMYKNYLDEDKNMNDVSISVGLD